jgi:hypothetical protein
MQSNTQDSSELLVSCFFSVALLEDRRVAAELDESSAEAVVALLP